MSTHDVLSSILYLLAVTALLVTISKNLGLGSILGLLIAGIIVGPHSPGPILTHKVESIRHITEYGVVLLLFVIGLEMKPKNLWKMRKEVFGLGSAQIILSGILIALYSMFYVSSWKVALLIGFTFTLSSTAFVIQILQDKCEMNTPSGKTSFSILLMQDLAIVPLLALVPILANNSNIQNDNSIFQSFIIAISAILSVIVLGKYLLPKTLDYLTKKRNREAFFVTIMLSIIFSSWIMDYAGLSMALGTFIMGMMLSSSKYHYQLDSVVEPYKGLLMALFFVAVGMSIDIKSILEDPIIIAQHLFVIMILKILVILILMKFMKYNRFDMIKVSTLLAQSGEFGFVLLGSAKALGVINDEIFILSITIISFSMLLTPLLSNYGDKLAHKLSTQEDTNKKDFKIDDSWNGIVIAGYGRVGRLIATMLEQVNVPYIAFDVDTKRVELGEKENRPVYYGELTNYDFISRIGLNNAKAVIVTVDKHHSASKIVSHIRLLFPSLFILSRTKDIKSRDAMIKRGASWAIPESIEGTLYLGSEVLSHLGKSEEDINNLLKFLRKNNYDNIEKLHEAKK